MERDEVEAEVSPTSRVVIHRFAGGDRHRGGYSFTFDILCLMLRLHAL